MGYETLEILALPIASCSEWFMAILMQIGSFNIWVSAVLVVIAFKFLFRPIFGYASSDLAHKSYNAFKRRKE